MNELSVFIAFFVLGFTTLLQSQNVITDTNERQDTLTLTDENSIQSTELSILPDKHYTFEQIRDDTTLKFVLSETVSTDSADAYWIKLIVNNPRPYAEKYMVEVLPMLDNTLYYYNENEKKWISYSNGLLVNRGQRHLKRTMISTMLSAARTAKSLSPSGKSKEMGQLIRSTAILSPTTPPSV